jgi:hypothetical protein
MRQKTFLQRCPLRKIVRRVETTGGNPLTNPKRFICWLECGHRVEDMNPIKAKNAVRCEECGPTQSGKPLIEIL